MPKKYRWTLFLIALIAIYLGWVYYERWSNNQALIEEMDAQKNPESQQLSDRYGDGSATVLLFYATAAIKRGQTGKLCYGVASAESVRIEPPVGEIWPSGSRCVDISPEKDTVYRLFAEDADGNVATAETFVNVRSE